MSKQPAILVLLLLMYAQTYAQLCGQPGRYTERIFPQVTKYDNIVFANDVPNIGSVYLSEMITQDIDLTMNLYIPQGDTLTKRPLVILAFGGAFIIGSKDDEDVNSICDSLAHRGYVTASISYRMGLNPLSSASAERAIYRAAQDYNSAVRYFKEFADTYGIDTTQIFAGGVSAGGFSAMNMAFLDEDERLPSTYSAGGLSPRPDLGCLSCTGNPYQHTTDVAGVINYWGAIQDINWIDSNEAVPMLFFHGENDLIVPHDQGTPFSATLLLPYVYGSEPISQRLDQFGVYNELNIFPGVGHNAWGPIVLNRFTPGPSVMYEPIWDSTEQFLYRMIKPDVPTISGSANVCVDTRVGVHINDPVATSTYCWQAPDGLILSTVQNGSSLELIFDSVGTYPMIASEVSQNLLAGDADTFWVTVHTAIDYTPSNGGPVCPNEEFLVTVDGGVGFEWLTPGVDQPTYQTSTATTDTTGYFRLIILDANGCFSIDSTLVETFVTVPPTINLQNDTLWASTDSVQWYLDGQLLPTNKPWITPLGDGDLYITSTDSNGCNVQSDVYEYRVTDVKDVSLQDKLQIYPNPMGDKLIIDIKGEWHFKLMDLTGKTVLQAHIIDRKALSTADLPNGAYLYEISNSELYLNGKLIK